jgi:hypothetical protein
LESRCRCSSSPSSPGESRWSFEVASKNAELISVARPLSARLLWLLGATVMIVLLAPSPGRAGAQPLVKGLDMGPSTFDANRERLFDESARAGSQIARFIVSWRGSVSAEPNDPTNPADPAYRDLGQLDLAVSAASARGQDVLLLVATAPDWGEGEDPPAQAAEGTWKPDPEALGQFYTALARRYSGTFVSAQGTLPEVRYFQVWAEPNLELNLSPQWTAGPKPRPFAPGHYRKMVNAVHDGVAIGNPRAQVIAAGTAPYGDSPGGSRMRPLQFLREMLCLDGRKMSKAPCSDPARFDIFGHNPINTSGGPFDSAFHPDDATTADFGEVRRILRAAERKNTVAGNRHPLWALELWWETNPPDERFGKVTPRMQATWLQDALYVLWRQDASAVLWFQLSDQPIDEEAFGNATYQSGLLFEDGTEKPSFTAFRFPFVAYELRKKPTTQIWTLPPTSGRLAIEQKGQGSSWRAIKRFSVTAGKPKLIRLRLPNKAQVRGALNGEYSLTTNETEPEARPGATDSTPPTDPSLPCLPPLSC